MPPDGGTDVGTGAFGRNRAKRGRSMRPSGRDRGSGRPPCRTPITLMEPGNLTPAPGAHEKAKLEQRPEDRRQRGPPPDDPERPPFLDPHRGQTLRFWNGKQSDTNPVAWADAGPARKRTQGSRILGDPLWPLLAEPPGSCLPAAPGRLRPSSERIWPVNPLELSQSPSMTARRPSSGGIGPASSLLWRFRALSAVRLPSSGGIGPASSLLWRSRAYSAVRLPSSGGIGPVSSFPSRPR